MLSPAGNRFGGALAPLLSLPPLLGGAASRTGLSEWHLLSPALHQAPLISPRSPCSPQPFPPACRPPALFTPNQVTWWALSHCRGPTEVTLEWQGIGTVPVSAGSTWPEGWEPEASTELADHPGMLPGGGSDPCSPLSLSDSRVCASEPFPAWVPHRGQPTTGPGHALQACGLFFGPCSLLQPLSHWPAELQVAGVGCWGGTRGVLQSSWRCPKPPLDPCLVSPAAHPAT